MLLALLVIVASCDGQEAPAAPRPAAALIVGAPLTPPDGLPPASLRRGLEGAGFEVRELPPEQAAASLTRETFELAVMVSTGHGAGAEVLAGLRAFQQAGGSLLFLGDVPHDSPAQLQDLQLARCPAATTGVPLQLTATGAAALGGTAPAAEALCGRPILIRGYPPDRLVAWADAGPLARGVAGVVVRRSWSFLGGKVGLLGLAADGGQPALRAPARLVELIVAALAAAARPDPLTVTVAAEGLVTVGRETEVSVYVRNNSRDPAPAVEVVLRLEEPQQRQLLKERLAHLEPGEARALRAAVLPSAAGPWRLTATAGTPPRAATDTHTVWAHAVIPGAERACAFGLTEFDFGGNGLVAYRTLVAALGQAGARWHRVALPWGRLEPEPAQYRFDLLDPLLEAAAAEGALVDLELAPEPRTAPPPPTAIPQWALRTPAVDGAGRPGAFPTLASEEYRGHCSRLVSILTGRYWNAPGLGGLSFDLWLARRPYAYDADPAAPWRFDYSLEERQALQRHLRDVAKLGLADLGPLWGGPLATWEDACPPTPDQGAAWGLYEEFRLGMIRSLAGALYETLPPQNRQLALGQLFGPPFYGSPEWYGEHRLMPEVRWGGAAEAGRPAALAAAGAPRLTVETPPAATAGGGGHAAVFSALRCRADSVLWTQAEQGVDAEELSRLGFALATCRGAVPPPAQVAAVSWEASPEPSRQLAWLAACLDEPCDLIAPSHEGRWPNWRLALLCPAENRLGPERRGLRLMSRSFVQSAREFVERGGRLALFTCTDAEDPPLPGRPTLRSALGLDGLRYTALGRAKVHLGPRAQPATAPTWDALAIEGVQGTALATTTDGRPVVVGVPVGLGQVILIGAAEVAAAMPADFAPAPGATQAGGVLPWLLRLAQVDPPEVDSGEQCLLKLRLRRPAEGDGGRAMPPGDFVAVYNPFGVPAQARLRLTGAPGRSPAWDLPAWTALPTEREGDRFVVSLDVPPYEGRFLMIAGQ